MFGNLNFTVEAHYRDQFVKRLQTLNLTYLENRSPHDSEFLIAASNEAEAASLAIFKDYLEAFNRRLQAAMEHRKNMERQALAEEQRAKQKREDMLRRLTFRKPSISA